MSLSTWNIDRRESSRSIRRAQKFVLERNHGISDYGGKLFYPLVCHVLPLGRILWDVGQDHLAFRGHQARDLVPPELPNLYTRFTAEGVEFIDDPKAGWTEQNMWITWFRSGGVEVRARPGRGGVGIAALVQRIVPFLARTAAMVLEVSPPLVVFLTLDVHADQMMQGSRSMYPELRLIPPESGRAKVTLPPAVLNSNEDFAESWEQHAARLMNQSAQAFGYPLFEPPA